jgi:transcriptional regulator with XRE-family HTH domain
MPLTIPRERGRPRVRPMVTTQLGQEVKKARRAKHLSLDALSKLSGLGLRTIHAIEQGESKHPTEATLKALASALEPETDYRTLALAAYAANGNGSPPGNGDGAPSPGSKSAPPKAVAGRGAPSNEEAVSYPSPAENDRSPAPPEH